MMDYTDLVKRLRVCKDDCAKCSMLYDEQVERDLVREHCAAYEAADAIEELQAAQKWIPAMERLPEETGFTLIFTANGNPGVCYFTSGWWGGYSKNHITHWMPLPVPPKEEA